jgi:DNA-binding CsgD family transcriptional regulator
MKETNDWIILNRMIYKIHTMEHFDDMRYELLKQLRLIVDFDSAEFYLADAGEGAGRCAPVAFNCPCGLSAGYEALDYNRGIRRSGLTQIYRETDMISDEARTSSEYYRAVYKPNDWNFALHMVMAAQEKFLGSVTLYRLAGKADFQYEDMFVLELLKDHLSYRLEQHMRHENYGVEKLTVSEAVARFELTRREHTILRMLMAGETHEDICRELVITPNTLKKHILNIYRKLGINTRVQLFKMIREFE